VGALGADALPLNVFAEAVLDLALSPSELNAVTLK
jgi:hypothetical protein